MKKIHNSRSKIGGPLLVCFVGIFVLAGCGAPAALRDAQRAQLAIVAQYAQRMAEYHQKVQTHLLDEKLAELDRALARSLRASANSDGKVPLAAAEEKFAKRLALEAEFRANLARLGSQFEAQQTDIRQAISLANKCLEILDDYTRVGHELRNLFFRERELENLVRRYADAIRRTAPSQGRAELP